MNIKPLLFAGAAYLAVKAAKRVSTVGNFTYSLESLPTFKIDGSLILIKINVGILNNREESFNIKNIFGELYINGSKIGTIENKTPFTISGYTKSLVSLSLNVEINNTILSMLKALASPDPIVVSVVGSVITDSLAVPLMILKTFRK